MISRCSPCPEAHADDGQIESNIRRAHVRMYGYFLSDDETITDMVEAGVGTQEAYLAVIAAQMLENETL